MPRPRTTASRSSNARPPGAQFCTLIGYAHDFDFYAAWARLVGRQTCVVHGNPNNPGNVRLTAERVALIDWDEAHVDVPDLDLVLPHNAAGLDDEAHDIAAQAWAAWEAAVCWDDEYSVKRLAEVRAV